MYLGEINGEFNAEHTHKKKILIKIQIPKIRVLKKKKKPARPIVDLDKEL